MAFPLPCPTRPGHGRCWAATDAPGKPARSLSPGAPTLRAAAARFAVCHPL